MIETSEMWSAGRAGRERELERAIVFQSVLLAMAAHDLRQPLQMIMSSYERLARGPHDSAEQRYMNIGRLAVARLSQQLDLLVEALRIHEHSANIQPTPVQLAPLFARLCKDNEDLASRKGVTLRAQRTSATVLSEPVLLESILCNLIRNALKFTACGGRVLVCCRPHAASLKIAVHDSGVGIPADKLSKIFGAFQRLDSAEADGLGLGLFVVRRAVDLLGHILEVHSAVGRGSCFSVLVKVDKQGDSSWSMSDVHGQ